MTLRPMARPHSAVDLAGRLVLDVTDDAHTDLQALFPRAVRLEIGRIVALYCHSSN
jgi:hypothetical protein